MVAAANALVDNQAVVIHIVEAAIAEFAVMGIC